MHAWVDAEFGSKSDGYAKSVDENESSKYIGDNPSSEQRDNKLSDEERYQKIMNDGKLESISHDSDKLSDDKNILQKNNIDKDIDF
jgi:hypothetical protein